MAVTAEDVRRGGYNIANEPVESGVINNGVTPATPRGLFSGDNGILNKAARTFTYTQNDWAEEAQKVGAEIGVNPDVLLNGGRDAIEKGIEIRDRKKKLGNLQDLYSEYPELEQIQYGSQAEAVQLLQNIENVKGTKGIFDALQQGIWSMNDQMKLAEAGYRLSTEKDPNEINRLNQEIGRLQKNLEEYRVGDSIGESVVNETAAQGYMMLAQAAKGATKRGATGMALGMTAGVLTGGAAGSVVPGLGNLAGATAGAVAGGLTGLSTGAQVGMGEEMQHMSYGLKYLELINKKDTTGERIYSDDEARARALAFSYVDAGIEFAATKAMGKAITAVTPIKSMVGGITKGLGEKGMFSTFQDGIGATIARGIKTGLKSGSAELIEEGLQDINEKVQTNLFGKTGDQRYSLSDIAGGAIDAMEQALPAVAGLSLLGGVGGGFKTMRDFRKFQQLSPEQQNMMVQAEVNHRGNTVISNLVKSAKGNELAQKNPELFAKIIQVQGNKAGVSTVYINAHEAVDSEAGQIALQDLVEKGVITQEEVSKAIEHDAPIEVPIGQFAQMATNLEESTVENLRQVTYYTEGGVSLRAIEKAHETTKAVREQFASEYAKRQEEVKQDILSDFADVTEREQAVADTVLSMNAYDIKGSYRTLYNELEQKYRETYDTEFKALNFEGEKPQWYTEHVAKVHRAPSNVERRRLAFEVGKQNAIHEFAGNISDEGMQEMLRRYDVMEDELNTLEAMDAMKDRLYTIADSDVYLRSSLSKEGLDVYNSVKETLQEGNLSVARQAKDGALLFAAHADVMAHIMRKAGNPNFTAQDYMNRITLNAKAIEGVESNGYGQPLNPNVNLDDQVKITNLTPLFDGAKNLTANEITSFLRTLAGSYGFSKDNKAVVEISSRDASHIARSSTRITTGKALNRNTVIKGISSLFEHAVIIESTPNSKKVAVRKDMTATKKAKIRRKNEVTMYHRLYVPVQIGDEILTVRLVTEERQKIITINPTSITLYDVMIEEKKAPPHKDTSHKGQSHWGGQEPSSTVSIREMLGGVKDYNNQEYINANGRGNYTQDKRGLTTVYDNGKRLVQLFESANFSTFVHESGHVFLEDLHMLANMENAPKQVREDWEKVKEWTGWDESDNKTAAHEKFATGFEAYLREGKAPTKFLQRVFRQFKEWLSALYKSVTSLGGVPSKEIQDIMARMLATQQEIDSWSASQALDSFERTGLFKAMEGEEQARFNGMVDTVREGAKERVMKAYMKELDQDGEKIWREQKDEIQQEIEDYFIKQYPVYRARIAYEQFGVVGLINSDYKDVKALEDAERSEGEGIWKDAVAREMKTAKEKIMEAADISQEDMRKMAEDYLLTTEGQARLTIEEANAIKRRTNKAVADNFDLLMRLNTINPETDDVVGMLQNISNNEVVKERVDEAIKAQDKSAEVISVLKGELRGQIDRMRALRGLDVGQAEYMMERAHNALRTMAVGPATSFKQYQNKSIAESRLADIALSKGKMDEAFYHKQQQLYHQAMARAAYDNDVQVKESTNELKAKLKSISRPKNPMRVDPSARYFIHHMMYQLGFTGQDGIEPLDGFRIENVMVLLDPDAEMIGNDSSVVLEQWIIDAFRDGIAWRKLTLDQFDGMVELINAVYTQGKSKYEGTTITNNQGHRVDFDEAAAEMLVTATQRLKPNTKDLLQIENEKTLLDNASDSIAGRLLSLTKLETILRRLDDDKVGPWARYIYEPINRATNKGKILYEAATKTLKSITDVYSKKELYWIRNERMYKIGNITSLTKEQVISLALNWGTENNRQRATETMGIDAVEMERAFTEILTDQDWEFVVRTWDLINSYFDERSAVQERLYGSPLRKEKGITFSIGGRKIEGQYYPIVYDPQMDASAKDYEVENIIRSQLSSNAVWGMGMSATKQRAKFVKDKKLLLSFEVIPRAVDEAINHIAMREATTDVNRLLNKLDISGYIVNTMGVDTMQMMRRWVRDNWQTEIASTTKWDRALQTLRKNSTFAIMGYRTSTALLNVLNIFPMMKELGGRKGVLRTISAIKSFYGFPDTYVKNRDFVMGKSIFLRERIHNLDRDMQQGLRIIEGGMKFKAEDDYMRAVSGAKRNVHNTKEFVNQYGYAFITETDLMISLPLWKYKYEETVREMIKDGETNAVVIEETAIAAGDRAVRRVFGSGDTKDTVEIQRSKNSIVAIFTPFYTYANTVLNAMIEAGYAVKDKKDYGTLLNTILFWIVIQSTSEALLRSLWDGEDDDAERLLKKIFGSTVSNVAGGLPVVRDGISVAMNTLLGERNYSKGDEVVMLGIWPKMQDTMNGAMNGKKSWIDVMRSAGQVTNRLIGFSDTISDGFWTFMKWSLTDTDATVSDLITSIAMDRRIKDKNKK